MTTQGQTAYVQALVPGMEVGQLEGTNHRLESRTVVGGQVNKDTVTIDSAVNDTDYLAQIVAGGLTETATFNSGGGGLTTTQIADGLLAEIEKGGLFGSSLVPSSATNVITLNGKDKSFVYTINSATAQTTAVRTQNADPGTSIAAGLGVISAAETLSEYKTCELPSNTNVLAQVDTLTPIAINDTLYVLRIRFKDEEDNSYQFQATSDADATPTEVVTLFKPLIAAGMPPNTVAESGTATLILTSEIAGIGFEAEIDSIAHWTQVHTVVNGGDKILGATALKNDFMSGNSPNPVGSPAELNRGDGPQWLEVSTALSPTSAQPVYVYREATGTNTPGMFTNGKDGTSAFFLPNWQWSGSAKNGLQDKRGMLCTWPTTAP